MSAPRCEAWHDRQHTCDGAAECRRARLRLITRINTRRTTPTNTPERRSIR